MVTVNPAVLSWDGESASLELDDSFRQLSLAPSQTYEVTCSPDAELMDITQAIGLPAAGSPHPSSPFVYAKSYRPQRISPVLWRVGVEYKGNTSRTDPTASPLLTPATVDWSSVAVEAEIDEDVDGLPILTAAWEKVPGIQARFIDPVATVKRNMASFNSYALVDYCQSTNSDNFLGWPPGTCKLMDLTAKDVNGQYYEVTGVFQFRRPFRVTADKAWYARWRHEGLYAKFQIDGKTFVDRVVDRRTGQPTDAPVFLDADGFQIPKPDLNASPVPPPTDPIWRTTKLYNSLPYASLGFFA